MSSILATVSDSILPFSIQPMLFCNPSRKAGILYEQPIGNGQILVLRSFHVKQDLPVIQQWMPSAYWNEFWQFPKPHQHPSDIYQAVQKRPDTHAIVGLLDELLICQIDLFQAETSDLGKHLRVSDKDCVVRFLFSNIPIAQRIGIAIFLGWYFRFPEAGHLYAIPGIQQHDYCRVLELAGFCFHRNCILTHQAASVYRVTNSIFRTLNYYR